MKKDPTVFLKHILESAKLVEEYIADMDKEAFVKNMQTYDAIV